MHALPGILGVKAMGIKGNATIRDVAEAACVSTATVSRVVNGDPRVAKGTAAAVERAIGKIGYRANQVARSLKTQATRTIAILAPELTSTFFMPFAESMDRELAARGYQLLVCSSRESAEEETRRLSLLAERLVDGVAVIPATENGSHFRTFRDKGMPLLLVDRLAEGFEADAVLVDNSGGAREATLALIADGHRRVGFLGGGLGVTTARERYSGYLRAMAESGLAVEKDFVSFGNLHIDSGYASMRDMLSRPGSPEAYFIVNADTHIGATNYLMGEGRDLRRRVVFASFDELPYSPLLQFCRYSVSQPLGEIGAQAARMLLGRIEGGERGGPAEVLRLKATLVRH
jgi:LacI family transcriptional regulator